jgi:hypothetical protein
VSKGCYKKAIFGRVLNLFYGLYPAKKQSGVANTNLSTRVEKKVKKGKILSGFEVRKR